MEVLQILQRAVTPVVVEVADIGRAVHGHEDGVLAADLDGALGVARVKGELRRNLGDKLHQQGPIDAHPRFGNIGARRLPERNRLVVAELAADLLEDRERFLMDQLDCFIGHDLVGRNIPDQGRERGDRGGPHGPSANATTAAAMRVFGSFDGWRFHATLHPCIGQA